MKSTVKVKDKSETSWARESLDIKFEGKDVLSTQVSTIIPSYPPLTGPDLELYIFSVSEV